MERFIESVRKYPCLWNTTAIEYRDQELKDAAWAEVMKETDLSSVKEVKLKWKKLRDSYRDALKRQNDLLSKEPGSKKSYAWKYMAPMQFLQPHMSVRKKPADLPPPVDPPRSNGDARSSDSSSSDERPLPPPRPPRKRPAPSDAPDPLDIFFNSMCQSTKRLPYPAQISIRRTLFDAVLAAEEALVAEQQSLASLWARAASSSSDDERRPS